MSCIASMLSNCSFKSLLSAFERVSRNSGSFSQVYWSDLISRGEAEEYAILVISLSMSVISLSNVLILSSKTGRSKSSSTALRRFSILILLVSGCSKNVRIKRRPIAVLVLSSTHKSEPFFSPERIVWVISKFLLAVMSRFINCLSSWILSAVMQR